MRLQFTFYLLFCLLTANAQPLFTGYVSDAVSRKPLEGVVISSLPGQKSTVSDSAGKFQLRLSKTDTSLRFYTLGYYTEIILLKNLNEPHHVKLQPKSLLLSEVTISDKPAVVYGSEIYWVSDFEFYGKYCLLLAYRETARKNPELFVLSEALNVCKTIVVPHPAQTFFRDAFGGVHLLSATHSLQINILPPDTAIRIFMQESLIEDFNTILKPVIAQTNGYFYYEQYDQSRMNVLYGVLNTQTREMALLQGITDTARAEMFNDELARRERLAQSGGFDYLLKSDAYYAANVVYKHPVASRLFRTGDSIYVADLCNKILSVYSPSGLLVRKTDIRFPDWERMPSDILTDDKTGRAYLYKEIKGKTWLTELNLLNGSYGATVKLDFLYAKHIRIHDGWVWFLYRTRETDEHATLYRQPV
jgi:hypothetical protein